MAETFQPAGSTHIAQVSYEPADQTLVIDFISGDTYRYFNVPVEVYRGFQRAGSVGSYFHRQVKGVYDYEQV